MNFVQVPLEIKNSVLIFIIVLIIILCWFLFVFTFNEINYLLRSFIINSKYNLNSCCCIGIKNVNSRFFPPCNFCFLVITKPISN